MNLQDRQLMGKILASYYEIAEFDIPGIESREFGAGHHKKIEGRHLAFSNLSAFRSYLQSNIPFFVSHSISYYGFPGATPMQKKQWKGADLVFDLDLHSEGKYEVYPKLAEMKREVQTLVNDFIVNDFGIHRKEVVINFSGNRGYHVHVRDPKFLLLGGEERRELVDYVMGQGLDYTRFFAKDDKGRVIGPTPDEGGYRGRLARETLSILEKDPGSFSRVFKDGKRREFFTGGIREGNWSRTTFSSRDILAKLRPIASRLSIASVNTDAGVTQDLSKLIRVPNSVHGDTGLIAKIVDDLDVFEPLRDALLPAKQRVKIRFLENIPALEIGEGSLGPFKKDEENEIGLPIAAFYVCKGSAEFSIKAIS